MKIMDAARYLVYLSYNDHTYSLTPLKLQKVLYYAQGWSYVWDAKPLFLEEFEAWQYGPVNREVYDNFKVYKGQEIPDYEGTIPQYATFDELETIKSVWEEYGAETAGNLVNMTHTEMPWIEAYRTGSVISNQSIQNFFVNNY